MKIKNRKWSLTLAIPLFLVTWIIVNSYKSTMTSETWYPLSSSAYHTNTTFQHIEGVEMFVRSPVFDPRIHGKEVIRMWALTTLHPPTVYCHVRFSNNKESVLVIKAKVEPHEVYAYAYCKWHTAVVLCQVSSKNTPAYVAISKSDGETNATVWHEVKAPSYKPPSLPKYGICLNTLFDLSDEEKDVHQVIEWFEMQKLLGVNNIILYGTNNVSSNVRRVLESYTASGFLIYHPWHLPVPTLTPNIYKLNTQKQGIDSAKYKKSQGNCITYYAQHLIYMDCIYKHVDEFTHLAIIDRDEYIVPNKHYNWRDMLKELESKKSSNWSWLWNWISYPPASYYFVEACFDTTVRPSKFVKGKNLTMYVSTKETRRLGFKTFNKEYNHVKSIVKPSKVVNVHVHFVEQVVPGYRDMTGVDPDFAQMNHFKKPEGICKLNNAKSDTIMSKYHEILVKNMEYKLSQLNLYK